MTTTKTASGRVVESVCESKRDRGFTHYVYECEGGDILGRATSWGGEITKVTATWGECDDIRAAVAEVLAA